jgi:hypothetical protein
VGPGSVWTGAENLAPTGIRSPDLPVRGSVATPTELSRSTHTHIYISKGVGVNELEDRSLQTIS